MTKSITQLSKSMKKLRKAAGLSQMALAYKAGISRFRLSIHEQGYADLTADEIQKILDVLRGKTSNLNPKIKSDQ